MNKSILAILIAGGLSLGLVACDQVQTPNAAGSSADGAKPAEQTEPVEKQALAAALSSPETAARFAASSPEATAVAAAKEAEAVAAKAAEAPESSLVKLAAYAKLASTAAELAPQSVAAKQAAAQANAALKEVETAFGQKGAAK